MDLKDSIKEVQSRVEDIKDECKVHGYGIADEPGEVVGILAEFRSPGDLLQAASEVREAGYKRYDSYSPFPIHGMDDAMGLKPSILGIVVFIAGALGLIAALLMQWYMNAFDYQYDISGKPFFKLPAFIPVTFEVTILFSAFATVFGMFHLNRLPRFHHPVFYSENFKKCSDDAFFICIEATDNFFDPNRTWEFFESIGAKNLEFLTADE